MTFDAESVVRVVVAAAVGLACGAAFVLVLALRDAVGTGIPGFSAARNRILTCLKWLFGLLLWLVVVYAVAGLSAKNGGSHVEVLLAVGTAGASAYTFRQAAEPIAKRIRSFIQQVR